MARVCMVGSALRSVALLGLLAVVSPAQTCLVLSQPVIAADGTATMDLSLQSTGKLEPAGLQWTLQYLSSSVTRLTVEDGPKLTEAGKTAVCSGDGSGFTCLAVGANRKTIPNGVIAVLRATLASGATTPAITIKDAMGVAVDGFLIPISPKVLPTTRAFLAPGCRFRLSARSPAYK